jgi:hypothetical protein
LAGSGEADRQETTFDALRRHLASLPPEELVELVVEEARQDEGLLDRLRLRAAAGGGSVDLRAFREAIDRAVDPGGYVSYAAAEDYARTLDEMIASLRGLLDRGHAAEAVDLVEYSISAIERVAEMIDDSDGQLGVAFEDLQELHRDACERADLDPAQLAERLFERLMTSEYDLFWDAVELYAPLLGEVGLRRYQELAEAEWERLPPLRRSDQRDEPRFGLWLATEHDGEDRTRRLRVTHAMELLAARSGDLDRLVAALSRDLSQPYSFLRVAEACAEAGREDDAIHWAEQGLAAFPDRRDPRLVRFLADAHGRRAKHARAAELMWSLFEESPRLTEYQDLKPHAERAGLWSEARERALDLLRDRAARAQSELRRRGYPESPYWDASELVRVHLWEEDVDAALSEARANGCSRELWLTLAERLRASRPEEALAIYLSQVEPAIGGKNRSAYQAARKLLVEIRWLMAHTGQAERFAPYLEQLRTAHQRKRSLMELLDGLEQPERSDD